MNAKVRLASGLAAVAVAALAVFYARNTGAGDPNGAAKSKDSPNSQSPAKVQEWNMKDKVEKSEDQWKQQLTPEQFRVTRKKGTERAFSGALWNNKDQGTYLCVCCGLSLFHSKHKFDSGTGWPSYWDPIKKEHVATEADNTLFSRRTEVLCARCGSHLGHVFEDGPAPTGLRYCINSASLAFEKDPVKSEQPPADAER